MYRPHITLLPGLDGTGLLYQPLLQALGDQVDVTRLGYATSRFQDREHLLSLIRNALPPDRRTLLVGESFSGPLAITTSFRHPRLVDQVVLLSSFCRPPRRGVSAASRLAPFLLGFPAPRAILRRYFLGSNVDRLTIDEARSAMAAVDPQVAAKRLRIVGDRDLRPELAQLPMPVHLVYGTADRLINAERAATDCEKALPTVHQHRIENGPHLLALACPEQVAGLLLSLVGLVPSLQGSPGRAPSG